MALEIRQTQKQLQKLLLTPHMQQSLRILQLPTVELKAVISQELEDNPMLEEMAGESPDAEPKETSGEALSPELQQLIDEDEEWREYISQADLEAEEERRSYRESLITKPVSFQEDLARQWVLSFQDERSRRIGECILGNLDESGYLESSPSDMAQGLGVKPEEVEQLLKTIQQMDPVGIGARDLRECLLIQLEHAGEKESLAYRVVEKYLEPLGKKRYAQIAKAMKVSPQAIKEAHERIGRLEPRPGRSLGEVRPFYATPDLAVLKKEDHYELTFANEGVPSIRINLQYKKLLSDKEAPKETREFLKEKLRRAASLIRCLNQRKETIAKVAKVVVEFQKEFLEKGTEHLKPLALKDVASLLGCHESTVSRVVMNKTIETPHGIFPLKSLFGRPVTKTQGVESAVTSKSVMALLQKWIQEENPGHPLSDKDFVGRLKAVGIVVARRTVASYREKLKILPSHLRKT